MTAMLRDKWGLNSLINPADRKDRSDHSHHAVDALWWLVHPVIT
ncbi:MAG: hypothetical protein ACLSE6_00235 [Alphaproteobacteria bacterium]